MLGELETLAHRLLEPGDGALSRPAEPEDPAIGRLARLTRAALGVAAVAVTLRRGSQIVVKAARGAPQPPAGGYPLDTLVYELNQSQVLRDLQDSPVASGMGAVRFYAGAPARAANGSVVAVISALDTDARPDWGDAETALLEDAAAGLESQLALRSDVLYVSSALRESEERYRKLYDNLPIGVYRAMPKGRVLMANRAFIRMLGYGGLAEMLSEPEGLRFREEGDAAFLARLEAAGEIKGAEAVWRTRTGEPLRVRETVRPFRGPGGAIRFLEGTVEDISEACRVNEALRATEARFQAFMEHNPCAALIKDPQGRRVYVNRTLLENRGGGRERWLNTTDAETYPPELAARLRANDERVLAENCVMEFVDRLPNAAGEPRDVLSIKFPFTSGAGEKLLGAILVDMTENLQTVDALRTSQDRLQLAYSATGISLFDWDVFTGDLTLSESSSQVFGIEVSGRWHFDAWAALIHPEDWEKVSREVQRMLASGERHSVEYRVALPDGSLRWVTSMASVVERSKAGNPLRVSGINMDSTARRQAEEAMRAGEERFRVAAELTSDMISEWDVETGELELYGVLDPRFGLERGRLRMSLPRLVAMIDRQDRLRVVRSLRRALREGGRHEEEFRVTLTDGSVARVHHRGMALLGLDGKPRKYVGASADITQRKRIGEEVARLAAMVQSSGDAIIGLSLDGRIQSWNRGAEGTLLYPARAVLGWNWAVIAPETRRIEFQRILDTVRGGGVITAAETSMLRSDGSEVAVSLSVSPVHSDSGRFIGISAIARDITDIKRAADQLSYQAEHDLLTNLPNRRRVAAQLELAIARARQKEHMVALVYIDLDGFKLINDTFGHAVGDGLLREVGQRLETQLRHCDMLARMGGDEFMLLLEDVRDPQAPYGVAQRALESLEKPFTVAGRQLFVGASIGVSLFPLHARDAAALQKTADAAMYEAKRSGKGRIRYYTPDIGRALRERLELGNDLRLAVERGELRLVYQPQFCLARRRMTGVEALLRWEHSRLGMVPPTKFVPIAEETGLILPIGEWVIAEACRAIRRWSAKGISNLRAAVNVSAIQFMGPAFVDKVRETMRSEGVSPSQLELELTESVVFANFDEAAAKMRQLRELGVRLAMDDFGTGFSSLSYLQRLPIDALKIDRSFVTGIGLGTGAERLIQAIVALSHGMGLRVVIEGLETEEQTRVATDAGCDEGQGFLLGRPKPGDYWIGKARRCDHGSACKNPNNCFHCAPTPAKP
jgi:diguanylate cyclase (GGDEF)-like protein/PAS domain S-box-containing protein